MSVSFLSPSTSATNGLTTFGDSTVSCRDFLGFNSWDCGVGDIDSEESLKNNIWTIAANVATDITILANYLLIGYVIYAGYLYIFSSGEPGKVATSKKALAHAFTGLAIILLAHIILNSIRIALLGGNKAFTDCVSGECVKPNDMVLSMINWVIGIVGFISAIFVTYGGIMYATSSGDPAKLKKAKDTITYSLIGLAIVALSLTITAFVSNTIRSAGGETSFRQIDNKTTISKEVYDT